MTNPRGWSLRARTLVLLVVTLLPLAGLGVYAILREAQDERIRADREAQDKAALVAAEVGHRAAAVGEMLAVLTHLPSLQAGDWRGVERVLRDLLVTAPHLENLGLVSLDGIFVVSAIPLPPGNPVSVADRDWFQQAIDSRQPTVSGFQVGRVAGKPMVVLAHPVLNKAGQVIGVLTAALRLPTVSLEVAPTRIKAPVVWTVVDREGVVLLHSEPWGTIGKPLGPPAGMRRAEAIVPGTPWVAIVGIPEAVLIAQMWEALLVIGLPTGVILVTATGIGFWLARNTWRPLQALTAGVRRIGTGDPNIELPVAVGGEVGEVATAIQEAVGALASRDADLTKRNRELTALLEATRAVASSFDLEQTLHAIAQQAATISGAPLVRLFLLETETRLLRCHVAVGLPQEAAQELAIPMGESLSGRVAATGEPLAVADTREDPRVIHKDYLRQHNLVSYLGLPVKFQDALLGVLVFNTRAPHLYGPGEVAFLSAFGQQAALAIQNAQLYHQERRRRRQLEAVRDVAAEISRELDLPTLLGLIVRRAVELVGAKSGEIHLWEEATQMLVPRAWPGLGEWMADVRYRLGEAVTGTVAHRRQGLIVNDYRSWPGADRRFLERTGTTAVLGEPLLYRDRLVGVITINNDGVGRSFTEQDREILGLFATQAAIAIENARLHQAAVRRGKELEALLRATRTVMAELDLQGILEQIVTEATQISDCSHVKLLLLDKHAGVLRIGALKGTTLPPGFQLALGTGLSGLVAQTGEPLFTEDAASDSRNVLRDQDRELGVATYLGLPVKIRNEVLGVLAFNTTTPHRYSADELAYLGSFADHAAIAIENARLFAEVNQSYRDLQRALEELVRAEKLRALGQMAAGIAHDLNNTLAAILGQAELLRLRVRETEVQQGLDTLVTAATDGAHIVRRLQGFARQQPGGPLHPCDLAALIQEAVELTRPRWRDEPQRRGAVIEVQSVLPTLPPVLGHPAEVREALTNLILNAVDAMPQGGILTLTARLVTADRRLDRDAVSGPVSTVRHFVELILTDTGIGMTEEVRRRIFEPFFTTKGGQGTGLGLALVYGIMERHGGHIAVVSTPGKGTTVTLRFQAAPAVTPVGPSPSARPGPPRRLLLIDDDPTVRRTVASLLRTVGHTVVEADGGAAGLAGLPGTPVDCVLTDLGMPEVTGWDVARAVRASHPTLPVILLTGWGDQPVVEGAERQLVDKVLGKPFRLEDLLTTIAELTAPSVEGQRNRGIAVTKGNERLVGN